MKFGIQSAIITALIGLGISKLFAAKSFIDKLEIELKQIKIDSVKTKQSGFTKLFYTVELVIINPVNFAVTIESIFLNVYFFKSLFGKAQTVKKTIVAAKKKTIIPILFEIDLKTLPEALFTSVVEAIDKKSLTLNVVGKINFSEGSINFGFKKLLE